MRPKKTVLYVSPCEFRLSRQAFFLETRGFGVLRADNSEDALNVLDQAPFGSIDVMVCDLLMPRMDGNELSRRAKQMHPGLPVVLESDVVTSFERALHADVFLPKGCNDQAQLYERIRILAARKRGPKKRLLPPVFHPVMEERVVA